MGKTSPLIDGLAVIFKDIGEIQNIISNSNELKKTYVKTNFDDTDDVEKLLEAAKELIEKLEVKTTQIHACFKTHYTTWKKDLKDTEQNSEASIGNQKDSALDKNKSVVTDINGHNETAEVNSTADSTSKENGIDKNISNNSDNVTTSTENAEKEVQSRKKTVNKEPDGITDQNKDAKVFLKCVDINKLISPNILPHLNSSKSASNKRNDPVFIILDSDSEGEAAKSAKKNNKTNAKGSVNNKKTLVNETISSGANRWQTKERLSRSAKKRKIIYTQISSTSSEASSLSDVYSDSADDLPKLKRTQGRKKVLFSEEKILDSQSDKKFSYKSYVRLEKVPCEKLKEHYLQTREDQEINRLTNLKSLQKRFHANSPHSSDSDRKSKRKRKSKSLDPVTGILLSDASNDSVIIMQEADASNNKARLNKSPSPKPDKPAESDAFHIVLDAITGELQTSGKSNDDSDHNEETLPEKDDQKKGSPNEVRDKVTLNSADAKDDNTEKTSKEKEADSNCIEDHNKDANEDKTEANEKVTGDHCSSEDNTKEQSEKKDTTHKESNCDDQKSKKSKEKDNSSSSDEKISDGNTEKKLSEKESDDETDCENRKTKKAIEKEESDNDSEDHKQKKSKEKEKPSCSSDDNDSEDDKKKKSKEKETISSPSDDDNDSEGHKKKKSKEKKKSTSSSDDNDSEDNKKKKLKEKKKSSSSSDGNDSEDDKEKKSKEKKKSPSSSDSNDSEDNKKKKSKEKKSKWRKDKLLTEKLSETDSEVEYEKYKKNREKKKMVDNKHSRKKKKSATILSDSDEKDKNYVATGSSSSSSSDESEKDVETAKESKKRRTRIKRIDDSSEDEDGTKKSTRKTIRKVIAHESLAESTKQAEKEERERKARILERQKKYNRIFDAPQDASVEKLVLDFDEETKKELLSVNKEIVKKLKPHQAKGVQFMWNTCYESVGRATSTEGSGCILAHCMGLGKTLQVIALTHALLTNSEVTNVNKVLVVCPVSTVLNWESEYEKWLKDVDGPEINVVELVSSKNNAREFIVQDWHKEGGVLIIGYDMFRNITNPTNKRLKKKARDIYQKSLVDPGPDLVICDEGHLLKNEKTHLSIAMNRIRSVRRIVLTGTPMQNNLKEYYCMVQFVKPNLLGTYKEYINRFVNPITNGQYTDSTPHDIDVMRKRSHVLHTMLDGIVQRKDYSVLMPYLPPKFEYVLFLKLSPVQIKLYQHYKDTFSQRPSEDRKIKSSFLFKDFQEFQRICTHPQVLLMKFKERELKEIITSDEDSEGSLKDFIDDDESEKSASSSSSSNGSGSDDEGTKSDDKKKEKPRHRLTRNSAAAAGIDVEEMANNEVPQGWWSQFCDQDDFEQIGLSSKLYLLFKILQECELMGDKLLVFSQSLLSLNVIEYFLAKIEEATQKNDSDKVCGFSGSWALGLDYFRIDGSTSCDNRLNCCNQFNNKDNSRARLFLISTRAGGLGINLVGANRVVIFDVSWNPSHDTQSIYRVYRFGQTKPCYIYRFVMWGTMETKIYERQVTKQAISKRVIDEQQIDRHYNQTDLAELYMFEPEPTDAMIPLVPKDVLLGELLQTEKDRIYKYHEHQSLLENKEDEELNEAERKAAWEEFEHEKTVRVAVEAGSSTGGGWIRNLPLSSINLALKSIIQRDNPSWTPEQVICVLPTIMQQLRLQVDAGKLTLFERVIDEIRNMQANQQRNFQEYMKKQQQFQHQQQQRQMQLIQQHLRQQMFPQMNEPNEIVELID